MPNPSSLTLNFNDVLSTTLFKWAPTLQDTISTANAFFYQIMKAGAYKTVDSIGDRAAFPLMYDLTPTDSYRGYDQVEVTPTDGITTAFYDWRQASTPITISGLDKKKNSGEERMLNLLDTKTMQAKISIKQFFNKTLLQGNGINSAAQVTTAFTSIANGSTFVDPLGLQIAYDPTAALTIGNIPQATYTWWRNVTKNSTSTTFKGFLKELRSTRNSASKGPGDGPDLHLCGQGAYELYESSLAENHRNPSYQRADIPFENIGFYSKPVVWDEYVIDAQGGSTTQSTTSDSWYMFNTQFWGVQVESGTNFAPGPFVTPENQDASTALILWLGAVGCSNRRKQAVMGGIDTTIAA